MMGVLEDQSSLKTKRNMMDSNFSKWKGLEFRNRFAHKVIKINNKLFPNLNSNQFNTKTKNINILNNLSNKLPPNNKWTYRILPFNTNLTNWNNTHNITNTNIKIIIHHLFKKKSTKNIL